MNSNTADVGCPTDCIRGSSNGACGVFVLFLAGDVAAGIIGPHPGLPRCLVIFPGQLVQGIVGISCGVCAVTDRGDVAVGVVGVGVGDVVIAGGQLQLLYLCGGQPRPRTAVGKGVRQDRAASVLRGLAGYSAETVVSVTCARSGGGNCRDPLVGIVGVGCGSGLAVNGLYQPGHIVVVVVLPAALESIAVRVLPQDPGHPVVGIVVVSGGDDPSRILFSQGLDFKWSALYLQIILMTT